MTCKTIIMQGDQGHLYFKIKINDELINVNTIEKIEFKVGDLLKYYPTNVEYLSDSNLFDFKISQQETFAMKGPQAIQIRIKDLSGNIQGKKYGTINLQFSDSKEVL